MKNKLAVTLWVAISIMFMSSISVSAQRLSKSERTLALGKVWDREEFISYYDRAEDGDPFAQYRLGCGYIFGESGVHIVPVDEKRGLKFLYMAARQEYADAEEMLGRVFLYAYKDPNRFKYIKGDLGEAIYWMRRAARHGYYTWAPRWDFDEAITLWDKK